MVKMAEVNPRTMDKQASNHTLGNLWMTRSGSNSISYDNLKKKGGWKVLKIVYQEMKHLATGV